MMKTATATIEKLKIPTVNLSGINPVEFKVMVLPTEVTEKIGNIYLPQEAAEREQHAVMEGTIVACSPHAFTYDDWPDDCPPPQAGQTAIFGKYSGIEVEGNDGIKYRIMNDKDIVAVRS